MTFSFLPLFYIILVFIDFLCLPSDQGDCELCHSSCKTCSGAEKEDCTSCISGKHLLQIRCFSSGRQCETKDDMDTSSNSNRLLTTDSLRVLHSFFHPFIDFSVRHQVVFWPLNRPACLAVHLVPLPTRCPISVKNVPRDVSCVWMPSRASAVETGFTCTTECVWWIVRGSCFLISWLTHEHASSQHVSDASFFSLSASVLEGFLKVVHASHVPQSAHPAREIPLIAWAVRQTICCWTTPAGLTVCRATTPQRQNVFTVQLTVKIAIKEACVRVSMLSGGVRSWEIWRCGEDDLRQVLLWKVTVE